MQFNDYVTGQPELLQGESVNYDALVRIDTAADNALAGTNSYRATFVPQTTWFRWVVFGFFLINILVLSGESLSFSPVSVEIAQAFGV